MIRLLIGSSNVAMTYKPEKFKEYPPYKMLKCTRFEVFKVMMEEIKNEKEIIIAVIENFICDAVRNLPNASSDSIDSAIDATIKEFMGVVQNTAKRLPTARFAIAQPILRPRNDWYTERYEGLCRTYVARVNGLGLDNVSRLDAMTRTSQNFVDDQVHLTIESSIAYVNGLLYNSDAIFTAEIVDLEAGTSKKPERASEQMVSQTLQANFEKSVKDLDTKIVELNRDIFRRRFHDNLVMARIREDVDTISNTNKEDKIMISGMTSKTPKPFGKDEIKKWLKEMVSEALESIEKGTAKDIIFVAQGRSSNKDIPLAEVRLTSRDIALKIRRTFAEKKKAGHDFGRLYIANCVTLATRVRVEILKAMAKKFTTERENLYVIGYASRPVLHVKPKNQDQRSMWLAFSDALVRYGSGLLELDLGEAYRKAGIAFKGQLEQNFVVLHEKIVVPEKPKTGRISELTNESNMGSPRKRQRDDIEQGPETKITKN